MREKILLICDMFMEKKINILEFQSRFETIILLDGEKEEYERLIRLTINRLEEIIYCELESNYYLFGSEVVEVLTVIVNQKKNLGFLRKALETIALN